MDIITARPQDMDFKKYKALMKLQDIKLKHHLRGQIVWVAKLYPCTKVYQQLTELKMWDTMGQLLTKGQTFRGNVKRDLIYKNV